MKKHLLAVSLFGFAATLFAQPWQMVGSRAMGMGGAGVAVAARVSNKNNAPAFSS